MSIADGARKGGMIGCRESQGQMSFRVVGDIGVWMAIVASHRGQLPHSIGWTQTQRQGRLSRTFFSTLVGEMNKLSGWSPLTGSPPRHAGLEGPARATAPGLRLLPTIHVEAISDARGGGRCFHGHGRRQTIDRGHGMDCPKRSGGWRGRGEVWVVGPPTTPTPTPSSQGSGIEMAWSTPPSPLRLRFALVVFACVVVGGRRWATRQVGERHFY